MVQQSDVSALALEHIETYLVFRVEQALKQADVCGCRQCRSNALVWYMFWAGADTTRMTLVPEVLRANDSLTS
jgi:hypothetical protein